MKIYVDKIPAEGVELEEQFDPKKLSIDIGAQGVNFIKSIDAKAKVVKAGREAFVDVTLEAPVEYTCSRCLAVFQDVFKKAFNVSYEARPGDILDIDEDIRQEMIVDSPTKLLCKPDCKGLCPNCGQNFNVAQCECKK